MLQCVGGQQQQRQRIHCSDHARRSVPLEAFHQHIICIYPKRSSTRQGPQRQRQRGQAHVHAAPSLASLASQVNPTAAKRSLSIAAYTERCQIIGENCSQQLRPLALLRLGVERALLQRLCLPLPLQLFSLSLLTLRARHDACSFVVGRRRNGQKDAVQVATQGWQLGQSGVTSSSSITAPQCEVKEVRAPGCHRSGRTAWRR